MHCDDCGSTVTLRMAEYMDRKDKLGVVLCYSCRNGEAAHAGHHPAPAPIR